MCSTFFKQLQSTSAVHAVHPEDRKIYLHPVTHDVTCSGASYKYEIRVWFLSPVSTEQSYKDRVSEEADKVTLIIDVNGTSAGFRAPAQLMVLYYYSLLLKLFMLINMS